MTNPDYGKELILDLHKCNPQTFTRESIERYFNDACILLDMERCELFWWDDLHTPDNEKQTEPHLAGTSAVQFITTSSLVIHTLDIMERVYINLFSCKYFNDDLVSDFSRTYFIGKIVNKQSIRRI